LNTDLSVAPEIAQLADPFVPAQHVTAVPRTDGRTAAALTELAATPQRWWDLVRFDPQGPVRIPVPGEPGAGPGKPGVVPGQPAVWLMVLPPGSAVDCDCRQATALAGEAAEVPGDPAAGAPGGRPGTPPGGRPGPLRPGRVRVHGAGGRHRLRAAGPGYSVTLHVGASSSRSE
jgi:hypothetical protein